MRSLQASRPLACAVVALVLCALADSLAAADDRWWGGLDYLLWEVSGYQTQPLVTSSPFGTPRISTGVLPGASILYGGDALNLDVNQGGRIRLGRWFDEDHVAGLEASFFALGAGGTSFYAEGDGSTGSLGRPFFNDNPSVNRPDAFLNAFDDPLNGDAYAGSIKITTLSNIYSAGIAFRHKWRSTGRARWDVLCGYRFFSLAEGLGIHDDITVDGLSGGIIGTNFAITDQFNTSNQFNGVDLGLVRTAGSGPWSTEMIFRLALGNNHRTASIRGGTINTIPGFGSFSSPGGLLAQPTNIGNYASDCFAVLPEVNFNLRRRVTNRLSLVVGFTALYMSNVVRPGGVMDYHVNGSQFGGGLVGPATPTFAWDTDSLWLYGVNFGGTYNY